MRLMQRSHVVCLTLSRGEESRSWIPSKLYSYLGSSSPVLALVQPGDAADIIEDTRAGVTVPPDDVEQIARGISDLYERYYVARQPSAPDWERVAKYEARQVTGQLADVLNTVAPQPQVRVTGQLTAVASTGGA
jgi:hypothetical protein